MIQARDPGLVGKPFFARFDPNAKWISDLEPVFADGWPWDPRPEQIPDLWAGEMFEPA